MKVSCQDSLVSGDSLEEKIKVIKIIGFKAVELSGEHFINNPKKTKSFIENSDIKISTICAGHRGWLLSEDMKNQRQAIKDIKILLEYAAQYDAIGVITPTIFGTSDYLPFPERKRTQKEDYELLIKSLNKIGKYAEDIDVNLLLEPLMRYESHLINKLSEGIDLIDSLDNNGVKLTADFFHMNMEESDIDQSLKEASEYLYHVHLSDSNRKLPGMGHIDFAEYIKTLKNQDYNGYLAFEALKPNNPETSLSKSLNYIRNFL